MGLSFAPLPAYLYLYSYEAEFKEMQFNKANSNDTEAAFFDLHLFILTVMFHVKFMTNSMILILTLFISRFLDGDVPCALSNGVYFSQLIRFARVLAKFNARKKTSAAKLLQQITGIINLGKIFLKLIVDTTN